MLPHLLVWQLWRPKLEMSPGPCPCPSLAPVVALGMGCFSLIRGVLVYSTIQKWPKASLVIYPKMGVCNGLWEGETGLSVPSSVL